MTMQVSGVPSRSRAAHAAGDEPAGCELARAHAPAVGTPLTWSLNVAHPVLSRTGMRDRET